MSTYENQWFTIFGALFLFGSMGTFAASDYFRKKNPVKSRELLKFTAWLFGVSSTAFGGVMAGLLVYGADARQMETVGLQFALFMLVFVVCTALVFTAGIVLYVLYKTICEGFDMMEAVITLPFEIFDSILSSLMGSGKRKPAGLNAKKLFDEIEKADPANWWKYQKSDDQTNDASRRRQRPPQDGEEGGDTLSRN